MADIHFENKSLVDVLKQSRDIHDTKVFMRYFVDEKWCEISYSDFYEKARNIARGLLALGFRKGDKCALLSENRPEWGAAYFGTLMAGGINVPQDALLKITSWKHIIRESGASVLFVSKNFIHEFDSNSDELDGLKYIVCMDKIEKSGKVLALRDLEERGKANNSDLSLPKQSDLAAIIFTSGTTGQAKGVMLTHENIVSDIEGALKSFDIFAADNFLSVLPIHHTFECTCGFMIPMAGGSSITYARGLASKLILEDIKNHKASILLGVPLLFEKMYSGIMKAISKKPALTRLIFSASLEVSKAVNSLLGVEAGKSIFKGLREKAGLSSLRLLIAGGAPMPPEVSRAFNLLGFKFIQGYGLTESSPVLTLNPIDRRKDASIGLPIYGAELKIVDADSRGIGQIVAKGRMVMKGYYNKQSETDKIIKDGWLYTGDSGWVDEEGYYYIAGRLKNVIVTPAGKNVYPEEIESELNKSPYILESLVLGRKLEGTRGEDIEAVVVPNYEYFDALSVESDTKFDTEQIEKIIKSEVARLSSGLAEFKKVKYVKIRQEEFEKTSTRKIKRYLFTGSAELVNHKLEKGPQ